MASSASLPAAPWTCHAFLDPTAALWPVQLAALTHRFTDATHGPTERLLLIGPPSLAEAADQAKIPQSHLLQLPAPGPDPLQRMLFRRTLRRFWPQAPEQLCAGSAAADHLLARWDRRMTVVISPPTTPAPDPTWLDPAPAQRLRQRHRWGLGPDPQPCPVVALLSDDPDGGDAWHAVEAVGIAREALSTRARPARPPAILLIHPRHRRASDALELARLTGAGPLVLPDPCIDAPWQILPGCDLVLTTGPAPHALAWAQAAGVPCIQAEGTSRGTARQLIAPLAAELNLAPHLADLATPSGSLTLPA